MGTIKTVPLLGTINGRIGNNLQVIGTQVLHEFCNNYDEVESQVGALLAELKEANWQNPHELKARYGTASILGNGNVVFNIKGNNYRIWAKISYKNQIVRVLNAGTHEEYDNWDIKKGK